MWCTIVRQNLNSILILLASVYMLTTMQYVERDNFRKVKNDSCFVLNMIQILMQNHRRIMRLFIIINSVVNVFSLNLKSLLNNKTALNGQLKVEI